MLHRCRCNGLRRIWISIPFSLLMLVLVLAVGLAVGPVPSARGDEPDNTGRPLWGGESYSGRLPAGESVVMRIVSGPSTGFTVEEPPMVALSELAKQAVSVAPAWLRPRLKHRFRSYSPAIQDRLALIIIGFEDPRHIDEVAFTVATVPPEDVWADEFDERLLTLNAALVYEAAGLLAHVELVEVGDPETDDDFHTTARYRILDEAGEPAWFELSPERYYWYVVHPQLGGEQPIFVDPRDGRYASPEEGGVFWRDYYLFEPVETDGLASLHFVLEHPNLITTDDVQGWDALDLMVLDSTAVDPIRLAVETGSGGPVLVHYSYPGKSHDGVVIATTLPVEHMYENGRPALLQNLVRAGNANAHLPEGSAIAVIKDRDPFGMPSVEAALADAQYVCDVYSATQIPQLDLSGYLKVIVPSDQPRSLYLALASNQQIIEDFLSRNPESKEVVYQFHGATGSTSGVDHWDDLLMPGGLRAIHPEPGVISAVVLDGYPKLLDVLGGADILWDGQRQYVDGSLPLPHDAQAALRIAYFSAQNMPDRCGEMPSYYSGPDGTSFPSPALVQGLRSGFPQRSLYLHYGNCGEMQQVLGAAGRSALLPVADVNAWGNDHVWNELWWKDGWRNYTINRSDASIAVDSLALINHRWAAVFRTRGDGYVENSTSHYGGNHLTMAVTVTDVDGAPVDGARLLVATDYYTMVGDSTPLTAIMMAWTDANGEASIDLETDHDFYLRASSPLGHLPGPDANRVRLVACREETAECPGTAEPGSIIPVTMVYEESLPAPPAAAAVREPGAVTDQVAYLHVSLTSVDEVLEDQGFSEQTFERWLGQGVVDLTLLDATGYAQYTAGQPYTALVEQRGVDATELNLPIATSGGEYYLVVANTSRTVFSQQVTFSASTFGPVSATPLADDPKDGCGCRAGGGPAPLGLPFCFVVLFLLVTRKRSRRVGINPRSERDTDPEPRKLADIGPGDKLPLPLEATIQPRFASPADMHRFAREIG